MATTAPELTASDYHTRRASLLDEHQSAEAERSTLAYKHAIGEADDADLAAIRERIAITRDKVEGLDLAWQVATTKRADRYATDRAADRAAAGKRVIDLLAARLSATQLADEALTQFFAAWSKKIASENDLSDTLHRWITNDSRAMLVTSGIRHSGAEMSIAGRLMAAGIDLSGLPWGSLAQNMGGPGAMVRHVQQLNDELEMRAAQDIPEMNEAAE